MKTSKIAIIFPLLLCCFTLIAQVEEIWKKEINGINQVIKTSENTLLYLSKKTPNKFTLGHINEKGEQLWEQELDTFGNYKLVNSNSEKSFIVNSKIINREERYYYDCYHYFYEINKANGQLTEIHRDSTINQICNGIGDINYTKSGNWLYKSYSSAYKSSFDYLFIKNKDFKSIDGQKISSDGLVTGGYYTNITHNDKNEIFLVSGSTSFTHPSRSSISIMKIDPGNPNNSWQKYYTFQYERSQGVNRILALKDGNLIMVGIKEETKVNKTAVWIAKISGIDGKMVWEKVIDGNEVDYANDIVELDNGNLIFLAGTNSSFGQIYNNIPNGYSSIIGEINSNGDLLQWRVVSSNITLNELPSFLASSADKIFTNALSSSSLIKFSLGPCVQQKIQTSISCQDSPLKIYINNTDSSKISWFKNNVLLKENTSSEILTPEIAVYKVKIMPNDCPSYEETYNMEQLVNTYIGIPEVNYQYLSLNNNCDGSTSISYKSPKGENYRIFSKDYGSFNSSFIVNKLEEVNISLEYKGCYSKLYPVQYEINKLFTPKKPAVFLIDNKELQLESDQNSSKITWFHNGNKLKYTGTSFYPKLSGKYEAKLTNTEGCESAMSNPIFWTIVENPINWIDYGANPITEMLNLEVIDKNKDLSVKIIHPSGAVILDLNLGKKQNNFTHQVDFSKRPAGYYFMQLSAEGKQSIVKLVKK